MWISFFLRVFLKRAENFSFEKKMQISSEKFSARLGASVADEAIRGNALGDPLPEASGM